MSAEHRLEARGLRLGYDRDPVVDDLDVVVPSGRITAIIGANASGKSTLLRGLARLMTPQAGRVLLDGADVHRMSGREFARLVGLLPQNPIAPDAITVGDLVGRGRYPHQGWFRSWTAEDDGAVARALASTGAAELVDRPVSELSGGQRQRVWIAMALAQRTDILLLDEPTTFLDVNYQLEVLDLLHELNRAHGTTIVLVLHELQLAARYADHLIAMKGGRIVAEGAPAEVVTAETVEEVFGVRSIVLEDPHGGTPLVVPVGRVGRSAEWSI